MDDLVVSLLISFFSAILIYLTYLDELLHIHLQPSLIAGISFSYFFIVMLPATSNRLPGLYLLSFEFIFVVFGFTFALVSEKLILQHVEIVPEVVNYLVENGERYVLRCIQV